MFLLCVNNAHCVPLCDVDESIDASNSAGLAPDIIQPFGTVDAVADFPALREEDLTADFLTLRPEDFAADFPVLGIEFYSTSNLSLTRGSRIFANRFFAKCSNRAVKFENIHRYL